jgi:hypothetical protein
MRQSVSAAWGGEGSDAQKSHPANGGSKDGKFVAFSGSGHALGGGSDSRAGVNSRPAPARSQLEEDEALARQLQEQFLDEDQRQRR